MTEKTAEHRGTLLYMAPEILNGKHEKVNIYKQDVFSLGLCFVFVVLQQTNSYQKMLRPPWNQLVSPELALEIFHDVLQEWVRVIEIRMNDVQGFGGGDAKLRLILTAMLSIDIKRRPDFLELQQITNNYFLPSP